MLVPNVRTLDGLAADITEAARSLAEAFWPGLLTLVCTAQPTLRWELGASRGTVSLRMPVHPLALELLERTGPLALTTAAPIGVAAPRDCEQARELLGDAVEVYLDAGAVPWTAASTVVDARGEVPRVVRLGGVSPAELREVVPGIEVPAALLPAEADQPAGRISRPGRINPRNRISPRGRISPPGRIGRGSDQPAGSDR